MARKYKLGDKWSEDFDYDGMVEYGRTIDTKTSEKTIEKYADSLEDVNYHTLAKPLFDLEVAMSGDKEKIKRHFLVNFRRTLSKQLVEFGDKPLSTDEIYFFAKGGKVYAIDIDLENGEQPRESKFQYTHNEFGLHQAKEHFNRLKKEGVYEYNDIKEPIENIQLLEVDNDNDDYRVIDSEFFAKGGSVVKQVRLDDGKLYNEIAYTKKDLKGNPTNETYVQYELVEKDFAKGGEVETKREFIEVVNQVKEENEAFPNDMVNVMDSINAILQDRGYDEFDEYTYDVRQEILDRYEKKVLDKQGLRFAKGGMTEMDRYTGMAEMDREKDSPFSVEVWKTKARYNSNKPSLDKEVKTYNEALEIALSSIDDGAYKSQIMSEQGFLWEVDKNGVQEYEKGGYVIKGRTKNKNFFASNKDMPFKSKAEAEEEAENLNYYLNSDSIYDGKNSQEQLKEQFRLKDNIKEFYTEKKYARGGYFSFR
jgi:hypothetical protein